MRFFLAACAALLPVSVLASVVIPPPVQAVPEPTTLALLAAGVGGLVLARKLRGRR